MTNDEMAHRIEKLEEKYDKHDERLDLIEKTQEKTEVKITNILDSLKDIADDTRWIRWTFIGALIVGAVSAGFTLIVWIIQGGLGS